MAINDVAGERVIIIIIIISLIKIQFQPITCAQDNEQEQQGWRTSTNNCPYIHTHQGCMRYSSWISGS